MEISREWLKDNHACSESMKLFDKANKTDVGEIVLELLKTKKLEWANWLLAHTLSPKNRIRYAVFAARQVLEIYEKEYPDDDRVRVAIEAAEAVIDLDTEETRKAAYSAVCAGRASAYSSAASAYAASAAFSSAYSSADSSAYAASAAASAAASSAYAASAADEKAGDKMMIRILEHGIALLE